MSKFKTINIIKPNEEILDIIKKFYWQKKNKKTNFTIIHI